MADDDIKYDFTSIEKKWQDFWEREKTLSLKRPQLTPASNYIQKLCICLEIWLVLLYQVFLGRPNQSRTKVYSCHEISLKWKADSNLIFYSLFLQVKVW